MSAADSLTPGKPDPATAVETDALVRAFGDVRALDGLDLRIPAGGVYGLLGPNGAGKTTLVRLLATLDRPDRGRARVFGLDTVADADGVRARIALTGQYASLDVDLTGLENLVLLARLLGYGARSARHRATDLLGAFDLADTGGRQVRAYSGGMRRRLDLAASIVVEPELLFLDEPTTGLDPHSRNQLWRTVRSLVVSGTTVVLTTQYLDEADQLADRIGLFERGRLIAEGTPGELKARVGEGTLEVQLQDPVDRPEAERALAAELRTDVRLSADPARITVRIDDPDRVAPALAELSRAGIRVAGFALGQPSLDEVYLALTDGGSTSHDGHRSPSTADRRS